MSELVTKIKDSVDVIHDIGCDYSNISNPPTIPDAYTKTETDALLAGKVDNDEVYSKAVLNAILDSKADEDNVYSKTAADALLATKANAADVYTKTEADTLLSAKADSSTVDAALALKANSADVYTKTESDAALALKANSADVYTISQTDGLLDAKASVDDSSTTATMATWSADKLNVEFQNRFNKNSDMSTEQIIGKIGNKTLYAKFYDVTTMNAIFDSELTTNVVEGIYALSGTVIRSDNNMYCFPWQYSATDYLSLSISASGLSITFAGPYSVTHVYLHIMYTKQ